MAKFKARGSAGGALVLRYAAAGAACNRRDKSVRGTWLRYAPVALAVNPRAFVALAIGIYERALAVHLAGGQVVWACQGGGGQ